MIDPVAREQFESQVKPKLDRLRRRLRLYLLLEGVSVLGMALIAAIAVTLLVDRAFKLDVDMRIAQLVTLSAALLTIAWRFIIDPLRVRASRSDLALLVERRHTDLRSRLISAVELARPDLERHAVGPRSAALTEALVRQATQAAAAVRFTDVLDHRRARRRAAVALGCVLALSLAGLLARPTMSVWFHRNVLIRDIDWPQRNRLTVEGLKDGRVIVARGEDVPITASVDEGYEAPRQVFIEYQSQVGQTGRQQMPAVTREKPSTSQPTTPRTPNAVFTYTFERLADTLRCRVVGGDARTGWFTVEAVDRPELQNVALHVTPPEYTKTEPYDLRVGQTVAQALKGSRIGLRVQTNRAIADIRLLRRIGDEEQEIAPIVGINPQEFTAEDLPPDSATYSFRMTDVLGLSNISERSRPVQISVRLTADQPPTVRMRIRGAGEMIVPDAVLPVETEFADTYGLSSATLAARPQDGKAVPTTQPIEGFEPDTKTFRRSFDWVPAAHGFREGDRVSVQAEAADFDRISGPNVGRSQAIGFRIVSREELLAEFQRREQEYRLDFDRWVRRQEELYGEFLSLIDAADRLDEAERSRRTKQLARRQRDYAGRVGTTQTQFEQVLAEMRINRLTTPSVEERLGQGIVEPLGALAREQMPAAADQLDQMPPTMPADAVGPARRSQAAILTAMKTVLANMLKWEGFQEAVTLLRDIESMQRQINEEMEKRIIEEVIGGQPGGKNK